MTKQIIFCIMSFVVSATLGKVFIPLLKKLKVGQSERADGPRAHLRKQGTPTMGGIFMMIAIVIMSIIYMIYSRNGEMIKNISIITLVSIGFGLVGLLDDYKKVVLHNTDGLSPKKKIFGLLIISLIYSFLLIKVCGFTTEIIIPFIGNRIILPMWLYVIFIIFVMIGSTNAVNLTDGVDGLAGSVSTIMCIGLSIIAVVVKYEEVSVYSAICAGACFGFLIYNFYKAKVMMGDTGSLLLGGIISSTAIFMKLPLVLVMVAIIPILETLSDIIQVFYFQRTGKRIFKMAPLHHHFELSGWRENKVVSVFSIVTALANILAILSVMIY